ncbi:MAG TPA: GNAT family N-acetyltransferase [Pilimelia sp.]|nr:GNAT family N-acetyltransferase [Pilimelia sp.]
MVSHERLLAAYDEQLRFAAESRVPPGVRCERDGPLLRVVGLHRGFVSGLPDLGVDGPALDALIARQRDFFAARGEAVEWKTRGHDLPADLPQRLHAAGFRPEEPETVMVAAARSVAAPPRPPQGVVLRQVSDRPALDRIAAMHTAVWGSDQAWLAEDLWRRRQTSGERLHIVVAEAGGAVVAAAWLVITPGADFAGLWGGATLPRWRGRGVYRALVAHRARVAVRHKVRYLQVDASADSQPILRRLGFAALTTTTPYVWQPPAAR